MKKIIYTLLAIIVISYFVYNKEPYVIPDESIRFRIIANSDSNLDQATKLLIKKDLEEQLFPLVEHSKSIDETRSIIKDNQDVIKDILDEYNISYTINYGDNYFPAKEFQSITYNPGNYESLVISLGDSSGSNWWCVMYPPLCLLESNSYEEDVEYSSFFKEIISKFIS